MSRVSTLGSYNSALLNLFAAQSRQADAQQRLATEKIATDLQGFGRSSESITALRGATSRIQGFVDTGETVLARLDTQDLSLSRISDAIGTLRETIGNAIANEAGSTLLFSTETAFQEVRGGLNAEHQGKYLFSGGNSGQAPVSATTLTALNTAPSVASVFTDGTLKTNSRVSETTTLDTGFSASSVGTEVFNILNTIKTFNDTNVDGPFGPKLTAAQKTFLTGKLAELSTAGSNVVATVGRNGALYNQVEAITANNKAQSQQLEVLLGKKTDADLAQAAVDIKLSEVAIEASAQVINGLRNVSLLNFLS